MKNNYHIGATTGVFHPRLSIKAALAQLRQAGVEYVEIGQNYASHTTDVWHTITEADLIGFEKITLHAPASESYENRAMVAIIFDKIRHLQSLCNLQHVVFHPDVVEDFSLFKNQPFTVAFENMDFHKAKYQSCGDMQEVFQKLPEARMVLDVNHVWTNDRSMALARELYNEFSERIAEVHISGFTKLHDPLFVTEQSEIIRAVEDTSVPLIIESQMNTVEDLQNEIAYITKVLSEGGK